jgi:hypothetical protein
MASKRCNFCDRVGSQTLSNNLNCFNYSQLQVNKKDEEKEPKKAEVIYQTSNNKAKI